MPVALACGIEQQARRLDSVAGDDDGTGVLETFLTFPIDIDDPIDAAVFTQPDACRHGMRPNFGSMGDGIRNMRDECACLGSDFASLQTEAPIDTVRPVSM